MDFIREDGIIYEITYPDTQKRLMQSDKFRLVDKVTVEELKEVCKDREITGYSQMRRDELIQALKG